MAAVNRAMHVPGTPRGSQAPGALLEAQKDILEMIVRGASLEEVLASICRAIESLAHDPGVVAAILLMDAEGRRLHTCAAPGLPDSYNQAIDGLPVNAGVGTCCAAAARGEVVISRDIANDPAWQRLAHLPVALGLKAAWSMPIHAADGKVLGTIGTYFRACRGPDAAEQQLVEVLARTASLAITRHRTDAALRDTALTSRFLAKLAAATQPLTQPEAVMSVSARLLAEHLDVDRCAYASIEDERVFVITGDHPRGISSIVGRWPVAAFGPACEADMAAGRPFVVSDSESDPRIGPHYLEAYRATRIRAVVCVPLHKEGHFTAAMAVHQASPRVFTASEIELVATVVARCWETLERMRVVHTLRESEARYRAIVEATPECVKLVAADGTLLQMNAAGLGMIESRAAEAIGRSIYEVIAPEHRELYRAFNEGVCRGVPDALTFDIIGRKGTRRTMESASVPLPAEDGRFVQLAVARDITPRLVAERQLATDRARLQYAIRLSGVGFWHCTLPFNELYWDERVKQHFFLPPSARVTMDEFWRRIHPEDREATRQAIEASLRDCGSYDTVYRTLDPHSGTMRWIRALGGPAAGPDGKPTHFDGVTVDVTEQWRVREKLSLALEHLRQQDRRKDEFLATLAHELRNPLAPIRTGLQILRTGASEDQKARTREMMERQLRHLVRMVDDLLDISRVTLGKVELHREQEDFRTVLNSALETTRPLLESLDHELTTRLPQGPLPVLVDVTRMTQVMANLINNAAKFTPRGGRIQVAIESPGPGLVVRVSDNGIGIAPDMLGRVFDMFMQAGAGLERTQAGLGIGLTLVKRLVEMHGGSVRAESAGAGQGTTFELRLPLSSDP